MGMFTQETTAEGLIGDAPRRYAGMHERGTRNLLILVVVAIVGYMGVARAMDSYLLQQHWQPLAPDVNGLTVVGTLDSRGDYDRNLFKVVHSNRETRIELTDFGWRTIFNDASPLFTDDAGNAVTHALQVDNVTGYAMLEPYLRVGVARTLGQPDANKLAAPETPVSTAKQTQTLDALVNQYGRDWKPDEKDKAEDGGGSASGREAEHGITIPGDTLAKSCPVVLNSKVFTDAEAIEQPASVLTDKTYSVRLMLNREGRSRFYQWSRNHVNESIAFVLNGQVMAAARITQPLDVNWWDVTNIRDEQAAKTLANWVHEQGQKK